MPAGAWKFQADTLDQLKDGPMTAPVLVDIIVVLLAVPQKQPVSAGLYHGGHRSYNGGKQAHLYWIWLAGIVLQSDQE